MPNQHFDRLTAVRFVDGNVAGIRAFRAMLGQASPASPDPTAKILTIISQAVATVGDGAADTARKSAAVKLLELVAASLEIQAAQRSHAAWLESKELEAEHQRQTVLRLESKRALAQASKDLQFQSFLASLRSDSRPLH